MQEAAKVLQALVAAVFITGVLCTSVLVSAPGDISGHWAEDEIRAWLEEEWISGYPDGTFRPDENVTRAEFVVFIKRAYGIADSQVDPGFSDVKKDDWYFDYVADAVEAGLIAGHPDGTFAPGDFITRAEAAVIADRLLEIEEMDYLPPFADGEDVPSWAEEAVSRASGAGIMTGYDDGTFRPGESITRAETVSVLHRGLKPDPPVQYTVTFEVEDEVGGPVEDALVRVNEERKMTDDDGEAALQLVTGYHDYRVEKDGYFAVDGSLTVDDADFTFPVILGEKAEWLVGAEASPLYCHLDEDVYLRVKLEKGLEADERLRLDLSEPAEHGVVFDGNVDDLEAVPDGELQMEPSVPGEGPVISYHPAERLNDGATVLIVFDGGLLGCDADEAWKESPHDIVVERTDSRATETAELEVIEESVETADVWASPEEIIMKGADTEIIEYEVGPDDAAVTCESGDTRIVEVEPSEGGTCEVSGVRPGSTFILLTSEHDDYATGKTVVYVNVEVGQVEITPDPESIHLTVGDTATVDYDVHPGKSWVTFESDDTSVIEVDGETGEVTAVGEGSAVIELQGLYPGYDIGTAHVSVTVEEEDYLVLKDTDPIESETGVSVDTGIDFTFDRVIQLLDDDETSITYAEDPSTPVPQKVAVMDGVLNLQPEDDLEEGTQFTVSVNRDAVACAADEDVRPGWKSYSYNFTTEETQVFFSPDILVPEEVQQGEDFEVEYIIENTGGGSGVQEIAGREIVDGGIGAQWIEEIGLEPGQFWTETKEYTAVGEHYRFELETRDDTAGAEVEVVREEEAFFSPDIDAPEEVEPGEDFEVTFAVENTGGTGDTQRVEAVMYTDEGMPGEEKQQEWSETLTFTLQPGERRVETLAVKADLGLPHPEYLFELITDDDAAGARVTVVPD